MTVKEMMLKLLADAEAEGDSPDIDFCDDYDESAYCAYCGNHWSQEAEEKYKIAFGLECEDYEEGDDCIIVHCENDKEVNALARLLYDMAGYGDADEYDRLFPEPEEEEPEPENKSVTTDLCYIAYKQEVCDDDGTTHEETCTQGYWSGTSENKFFREVSYKICFSDCEPRDVVEIVWHGKRVHYVGWQPGMKYQYVDDNNELVWEGCFPEWDH